MAWLWARQGVIAVVEHRPALLHREVAQQHAAARLRHLVMHREHGGARITVADAERCHHERVIHALPGARDRHGGAFEVDGADARRECPGDVGVDCPGVGKALGHHGGRQRKPLAAGLIPSELNQHAKLAHARR